MASANSQMVVSGSTEIRGDDIVSLTSVDAGFSPATIFLTKSLSVIIPTGISLSVTTRQPIPLSFIFLAALIMVEDESIVITCSFIMSLTKYSSIVFITKLTLKNSVLIIIDGNR